MAVNLPSSGTKDPDGKESTTIRFEWTLRGLANIFESRYACAPAHMHRILTFALADTAREKRSPRSLSHRSSGRVDGKSVPLLGPLGDPGLTPHTDSVLCELRKCWDRRTDLCEFVPLVRGEYFAPKPILYRSSFILQPTTAEKEAAINGR